MRIAKKKNGKPNTNYPSKILKYYIFSEIDLSQQIADIDFTNFCLMYTAEGLVNLLNQSIGNASKNSKTSV